jgi:hypothetical protein
MTDEEVLAAACERLAAHGPVRLDLGVAECVTLIAVIQLASRHPAARSSPSIQEAVAIARQIQDGMAAREPDIGRLLERGWHSVFDVERPA